MALVIYIDVLLVVNLYINYFLVRGTSLMLRRKVSPRRVIFASAVGAVGSLLILVPDGNSLRDSFTGKPVVITSIGKVAEISPPQVTNYLNGCSEGLEGLRLAPCHTITSEGVVPVFSAEVLINEKPADVLVGVTREPISGADCIFDPNIII